MSKKLIGAFMALAAFAAFAVMPAVSSASPELTHPTGTTLATGSKITATLLGGSAILKDTSGNTLITCTTATLTGELTRNNGTEIQGQITSATYGGTGAKVSAEPANECTGTFGNTSVTPLASKATPWCLKSQASDKWNLTGGACPAGGGRIKFILNSTTVGECEYQSTAAGVSGGFTTHPEDAKLTVTESGFELIRGGFFCPPSGHLEQGFTLETDSATTEPLYIS
jgi:hypothetical protein